MALAMTNGSSVICVDDNVDVIQHFIGMECSLSGPDAVMCGAVTILHKDNNTQIVNLLEIRGQGGEPIIEIRNDGQITYGYDYKPDEAAKLFWEAIAMAWRNIPDFQKAVQSCSSGALPKVQE